MKILSNHVAEIKTTFSSKAKLSELPKISCSRQAQELFRENWDLGQLELVEEFKILILNRNHKVLGQSLISKGGYSGTVVDPKLVFAIALTTKASAIIAAHNHPSGNLTPSKADIALTSKLKKAGELLELPLLDHLILSSEGYFSFADEGLL